MDCVFEPSLEPPPPPQPASNVAQASPTAVSWNLMVCLLIGIFLSFWFAEIARHRLRR
jgi:hypothetical protein